MVTKSRTQGFNITVKHFIHIISFDSYVTSKVLGICIILNFRENKLECRMVTSQTYKVVEPGNELKLVWG